MTTELQCHNAIREAVVSASGLHDKAVVWGNAGQPVADPIIRLFVTSDLDVVPTREVLTRVGADYSRGVSMIREWTVQVRAETVNHVTANDALAVLGQTRLGIELQAAKAILTAAGVVLVKRVGPALDLAFEHGDVLIAARVVEYVFRAVFNRDDPTGVGTIEHAQVSGDVENPTIAIPEQTIPEL